MTDALNRRCEIGEYSLWLIDDPESNLTSRERSFLMPQVVEVARKGFGSESIPESDIYLHAIEVKHGAYVFRDSRLLAFTSGVSIESSQGLVAYLEGTAILPEAQGRGIYDVLIGVRLLWLSAAEPAFVATRTANPIVAKKLLEIDPYPFSSESLKYQTLAVELAQIIFRDFSDHRAPGGPHFEVAPGVFRMAYESAMNSSTPISGSEWLDDWFEGHLETDEGDAVLIVGEYQKEFARNLVRKGIERIGGTSDDAWSVISSFIA